MVIFNHSFAQPLSNCPDDMNDLGNEPARLMQSGCTCTMYACTANWGGMAAEDCESRIENGIAIWLDWGGTGQSSFRVFVQLGKQEQPFCKAKIWNWYSIHRILICFPIRSLVFPYRPVHPRTADILPSLWKWRVHRHGMRYRHGHRILYMQHPVSFWIGRCYIHEQRNWFPFLPPCLGSSDNSSTLTFFFYFNGHGNPS